MSTPNFEVGLTVRARRDLREITRYYSEAVSEAGAQKNYDRLISAMESLAMQPERYPPEPLYAKRIGSQAFTSRFCLLLLLNTSRQRERLDSSPRFYAWEEDFYIKVPQFSAWEENFYAKERRFYAWEENFYIKVPRFSAWEENFCAKVRRFSAWEENFYAKERRFSAWEENFYAKERRFSAWEENFCAKVRRFSAWEENFYAKERRFSAWEEDGACG